MRTVSRLLAFLALVALVALPSSGCGGPEEPVAGPSTVSESPSTRAAVETEQAASPTAEPADPDAPASAPPASPPAFFRAEGAPDPLACVTADDCAASGTVDEGGCCYTYRDMNAVAMSGAYRRWLNEHRQANCAEAACPPPPAPSRPPACLFELACDEGRCRNACDTNR